MRILLALWAILLLSGCQSDPLSGKNDPKLRWWSLDFFGPVFMEGLAEDSYVEDINGKLIRFGSEGRFGKSQAGDSHEYARGWQSSGGGSMRGVVGADLPKRIYVRWQSIVEQKTYRGWVEIPEEGRQIMRTSTERRCAQTPASPANGLAILSIGLAPGGVMQVSVRDSCLKAIKVARGQAEIEPLGPHLGKSGGKYYPQSEESKRYIEQYGIPYGSW